MTKRFLLIFSLMNSALVAGMHLSFADRLNIGPMFQFGLPMNDALSIEPIKSEKNRGFSKEDIDFSKLLEEKYLINVMKAHLAFGVKAAYEFGEDGNEKYSVDVELSYLWQRNHLTNVQKQRTDDRSKDEVNSSNYNPNEGNASLVNSNITYIYKINTVVIEQ